MAVDPNSGCNTCNYCHDGSYQHCSAGGINSTIGIYKDGGFSTHAIVPESQVRFYQFHRSNDILNFVNFFSSHFLIHSGVFNTRRRRIASSRPRRASVVFGSRMEET